VGAVVSPSRWPGLKGDLLVRVLVVFQRHLEVDLENGEVVADSSEGYQYKGYADHDG